VVERLPDPGSTDFQEFHELAQIAAEAYRNIFVIPT
jgi:hypothetical protein